VRTIIIGPSLSGKTTLVRYLRTKTNLLVAEIDEELTQLNNGEYPADDKYKHEVLAPKVIENVLARDEILFFTNTDYFTENNLKVARTKGFKIVLLSLDLNELKKRNETRVKKEGYSDLSQWLEGMVEYQTKIEKLGLVDFILDASLPTGKIAHELINLSD
jgi:predicted ABC-type ATPase